MGQVMGSGDTAGQWAGLTVTPPQGPRKPLGKGFGHFLRWVGGVEGGGGDTLGLGLEVSPENGLEEGWYSRPGVSW